ncbi:MAG: riboflavin synthase subunit alpha [Xenococcaceae cyanobacterium]
MLAISLVSLVIAAMSVYFSYTIKDEVFRVGIGFASLLFILITIVCSPWLLKLAIIIVSIPLLLDFVKIWSVEHFNE